MTWSMTELGMSKDEKVAFTHDFQDAKEEDPLNFMNETLCFIQGIAHFNEMGKFLWTGHKICKLMYVYVPDFVFCELLFKVMH